MYQFLRPELHKRNMQGTQELVRIILDQKIDLSLYYKKIEHLYQNIEDRSNLKREPDS